MSEKVLIKSEPYNVKKLWIILIIIGLAISICGSIGRIIGSYNEYQDEYGGHVHTQSCYLYEYRQDFNKDKALFQLQESKMDCTPSEYKGALDYALTYNIGWMIAAIWLSTAIFAGIGLIIYLWLHSYELTVTDKRIYGKVAWGKRVDLPVDSVSATSTVSLLKCVAIFTSSGKIKFLAIKNANEIYKVISDLLIERQSKRTVGTTAEQAQVTQVPEQLKKYKELLDQGIITQEEFDAKKKQLLGL